MARVNNRAKKRQSRHAKRTSKTPSDPNDTDAEDGKKKEKPSPHTWDGSYLCKRHHKKGCVNRHVGHFVRNVGRNKCSHRGQARLQALGEPKYYFDFNDPAEPVISELRGTDGYNFFAKDSSCPWEHEAHHIVANAELRNGVEECSTGFNEPAKVVLMIRGNLMKEGYNLNEKVNMIVLPEERDSALAVGLPKHRKTKMIFSHDSYSRTIKGEVKKKFAWLKEKADEHGDDVPDYEATRTKIEQVSKQYYGEIKNAGKKLRRNSKKDSLVDFF